MIVANRGEAHLPGGVAARVRRRLTPEPERALPRDPVAWIRDDLDEHVWSHQVRLLRSVQSHDRTAWKACHGPGKSFIVARLIAWWIAAHPVGEAMAIWTAPSGDQVRKVVGKELRRAHRKAGLPGYITDAQVPEWKVDGEVVAFGRKPQDFASPEQAMTQFQGQHADYILVVLDEAGGVPEWLWDATTSLMTNETARAVAIGNPDDPSTRFERNCRPGSGWNVLTTSIFETPNFTGERVPEALRRSLPSQTYVDIARRDWGEDHPYWFSKVLGEFPETSEKLVITPKMIREAHARSLPGFGKGRGGLDWAAGGNDETVFYRNRDGVIRIERYTELDGTEHDAAWKSPDPVIGKTRVRQILERMGGRIAPIPVVSDVVGVGWGPTNDLRAEGYGLVPYNAGEAARNPRRFVNRRAEAWWAFREGLEAGLIDLDPDDELLAVQLQQPRWSHDASGRRIKIESKEDMAKRGLKSPDRADAAVQSWYELTAIPPASTVQATKDEQAALSLTADLLDKPT